MLGYIVGVYNGKTQIQTQTENTCNKGVCRVQLRFGIWNQRVQLRDSGLHYGLGNREWFGWSSGSI